MIQLSFDDTVDDSKISRRRSNDAVIASKISSLCFNDAAVLRRQNKITEDEYLQALVDHCNGLRHGINRACNNDTTEPGEERVRLGRNIKDDSFAKSIAGWIYRHFDRKPIAGNMPDLFQYQELTASKTQLSYMKHSMHMVAMTLSDSSPIS
jgi:hypothetical protein